MDFQTIYLPIGVPSYDLDEARMKYNDSIGMLKKYCRSQRTYCVC